MKHLKSKSPAVFESAPGLCRQCLRVIWYLIPVTTLVCIVGSLFDSLGHLGGLFRTEELTAMALRLNGAAAWTMATVVTIQLSLAVWQWRRTHDRRHVSTQRLPSLSVLVPAFNEEAVICRTVRSLLQSDYAGDLEVIVIDDGSKDATFEVLKREFLNNPKVVLLTQPNGGKSEAMNHGLSMAKNEIVVVIDADTVVYEHTLYWLVQSFSDPLVAAVSGNMKVGNRVNALTAIQAIEYVYANSIERRALERLESMTVVAGAIGAYRANVLRSMGGHHRDTLAEDTDITVHLLKAGWRVRYEPRAMALTEAPQTLKAYLKQRFRWCYGDLQVLWKHRQAIGRLEHRGLGLVGLPWLLIDQFVLTLLYLALPLVPLFLLSISQFDPSYRASASQSIAAWLSVAAYLRAAFAVSAFLDSPIEGQAVQRHLVVAMALAYSAYAIGSGTILLANWSALLILIGVTMASVMPLLEASLVWRSVAKALKGGRADWNKLQRTATLEVSFSGQPNEPFRAVAYPADADIENTASSAVKSGYR